MSKPKKLIIPLWFVMIVVMLAGCTSLRKAELSAGNDPEKAIAELTEIMKMAQQDQIDVLADEEFMQGSIYLSDAKRGIKEGDLNETIINNAAVAKAFFEDARKTAEPRKASARRILEARASALGAGVRKSPALVENMMVIDEDLKNATKRFSRRLPAKKFSEFQKKYLILETNAVQFSELNSAKQAIKQAFNDNADDLAPKSLQTAQLDYEAAMNMIAQSPRSPDLYKKSVDSALASATQLYDVMNIIMDAKGTPENIAVQIVKQKRKLGELSSNVGKLEQNLKSAEQTLQEKEGALKQKDSVLKEKDSELKKKEDVLKSHEEQLARASTQVRFQQAMDDARQMIPASDALVYQQGNKLVFRLKRMNFRTGTSIIPEFSKLLLDKVDSIIKKLDAEKVTVQGHTDSVGSELVNKRLSQERALSVANYLYALKGGYKIQYAGFGEAHPIASNETSDGRATNRRVDLVVSVKQ